MNESTQERNIDLNLNHDNTVESNFSPNEENTNANVPRMGILLNGRSSIDPPPLQLPPLYLQSDQDLDHIVHEHHDDIETAFRNSLTSDQSSLENSNITIDHTQNRYHNYTLIPNDSDSENEGMGHRSLIHHHNDDDDEDIDSEEEEIRREGRRGLLFNNNNTGTNNNNNSNNNNTSSTSSSNSNDNINENDNNNDNNNNNNNNNTIQNREDIPTLNEPINNRRTNFVFVERDEVLENNEDVHPRDEIPEENDLIDEIDVAREVENHQAQQEARNEAIQNENFGIHCKYQSEKLMNKTLSWTLNLCLTGLQSRFSFEFDEFLNLLHKYEKIRNENIFDKNLFLLRMNIIYYQKRFKSYKRQLIYIMNTCRNLLIISDDPYYKNFNNVADENRYTRHHLNDDDEHSMSDTIINPESVASIRSLLDILNSSFLKIEKYDKDLFEKDNYYISTNILKHSENDSVFKPSLPQNITVYPVSETTYINSMVNSIKEENESKMINNVRKLSRKDKGKLEMVANDSFSNNTNDENVSGSQNAIQSTENYIEKKLSPIPIREVSSLSTISVDSDGKSDSRNSNDDTSMDHKTTSTVYSSSSESFHSFFNINPSSLDNDSLPSNDNKSNSSSVPDIKLKKNSVDSGSGTTLKVASNEKIPSKIQNFPPEILAKIFRYVRINSLCKKSNKNNNKKSTKDNLSTTTNDASTSSSSSLSSSSSSSPPSSSSSTQQKDSNQDKINNSSTNNFEGYTDNDYTDSEQETEDNSSSKNYSNANAYNAVYNCILVCRHWSYLAQRELYHTLSFNFTNIINSYLLLKIAASLEVISKVDKNSPTRTIVLRVSHDGKVPDSKEWYDRKGELAFNMILRNCPNLQYVALFGVNFSNLTAEVISSVCTDVHQLLFIPFAKSYINERSLLHITEHCHKISSLILSFFTFTSKANIKKIFKNLEPTLKNLDLIQVECEESDFNYIIPYLKNIEEIGLMLTTSFNDTSLTLLNRHCPKLEYINFTGLLNISDQGLENLFTIDKDSKFMNENLTGEVNDDYIFHTNSPRNYGSGYGYGYNTNRNQTQRPKNRRVKRINLSDCMDITDEGLKTISNNCEALEAISIDDCPRITDEGFEAFIKQQPQIKYLSIANSESLTDKSIECLNKYCPYIEKLNIKGCLKMKEKTIKNFLTYHANLNTLCFHKERNTFSRGFINYLNKNYSTEDFDDMFLKWNQ